MSINLRMKKRIGFINILLLLSLAANARVNEFSLYLRNGLLLNKGEVKSLQGSSTFTTVKNTLQQGLGVSYTRFFKSGLLLSAAAELGYENYTAELNYPFEQYYFERPVNNADYRLKKTIYTGEISLNIGYRLQMFKRFNPEIRVGQILHMPLNNERFDGYGYGNNSVLGYSEVYYRYGFWGSTERVPIGELLNSVYLGTEVFRAKKANKSIRLGIQWQKKLIMAKSTTNYLNVTYSNANGAVVSREEFNGHHNSLSLILGIVF